MKVLVITYYWVPAGGSGVQRWLKFVKYLRDFGIEPVVFTVENPNYPIEDTSLISDVPEGIEILRNSIFEPNDLLLKFKKDSKKPNGGYLDGKASIVGKFLQYIRANYFIPDARKFWVKPSVAKIKKYIAENSIDVIITTGPPHSVHLIGLALKKALQIKWLADFRDPWTSLYYNDNLNFTTYAKKKNLALEQEVLQQADKVITVSNSLQKELQCATDKIAVVTNGFDGEVNNNQSSKNIKFTISYIGFLPKQSNPIILWEVLEELVVSNENFKRDLEIRLTGSISREANLSITQHGLDAYTRITGYVPHKEAIEEQLGASILLLLVPKTANAKGIVTGKVFEYLQAKRPILAIGPEHGDLAAILNETSAGVISDFENKTSLKNNILNYYKKYQNNTLLCNSKGIEKYHRKNLTKELAEILKDL